MVDWAKHFDKIYWALSVSADMTLAESNVEHTGLRVIDKTSGVVIDGVPGLGTIKPGCVVRTHELDQRGILKTELRHSLIEFNGGSWRIESFNERPADSVGELLLILTEAPNG